MTNRLRLLTGLLLLVFTVAACADSPDPDETVVDDDTEMMDNDAMASGTVVDVAMGDDRFETLVNAIQAAGLVETLQGPGPFTVFAPTDDAFAKLPAGTLDDLMMEENRDDLRALLTYHVVPSRVLAADVSGMASGTSVQGEDITVSTSNGTVMLNGTSTVTAADIMASNGVIHVIDTVIMPPSMN